MFIGDKWAECGLSSPAGLGSNRFGKAAQDLDGFGERLRKDARGVPIRGAVEDEPAIRNVGGRFRHLPSGKTGTIAHMGTGQGQCIAVGFDDGSIALCESKDLESIEGPAGARRMVPR
jgi:hypothetical protein